MSDLIERLRDRYSKHSQELRDEAADEIEHLTTEKERLMEFAQEMYIRARYNPSDFERDVRQHLYGSGGAK